MALISVIIPVFKVEPYICRCVDSILGQTFSDFDLILVDDGSPDNCGRICDEYATKDKRIHVIHQENGGLSAARNAGIDWAITNSGSRWLAFVDSDDWIHPDYLAYLYRAALDNEVKISICDYLEVDVEEEYKQFNYQSERITGKPLFIGNIVAWNKLYSKDLFDRYRYPVGKLHEDEFLTYKLLDLVQSVAYVHVPLYFYFRNNEGITKKEFSLKRLDAIEALEERLEYFKKKGDPELISVSCLNLLGEYVRYSGLVADYNGITANERKQIIDGFRKKARKILLRYGGVYFSIRNNLDCYDFAFPGITPAIRSFYKRLKLRLSNNE